MRGTFLLLSLILTLAIVGVVVKKQLASVPGTSLATPGRASPAQSAKAIEQQYKQAIDAAMQPAKRDADEK